MDLNVVRMTVGYVVSHKNSKFMELTQYKNIIHIIHTVFRCYNKPII
jgi:hypothetical protein